MDSVNNVAERMERFGFRARYRDNVRARYAL